MQRILRALFERLSRVTSSGRFIPQIDGLRFVAITGVVLFHVGRLLEEYSPDQMARASSYDPLWIVYMQGFSGVQLFFTISGFILALPFAEYFLGEGRPIKLSRYFIRRVTRLEPPYFVNLFAFFFLRLLIMGDSASVLGPHLLTSFFYVHNIVYDTASTMVNPVAWSLEIEVQFYILAPLICSVFMIRKTRLRRLVLLSLLLGLGLFRGLMVRPESQHGWNVFTEGVYFMLGVTLADIYLVTWKKQPKQEYKWDVISSIAWLAMAPAIWYLYMDGLLFAALIFIAYIGAFRGVILSRLFSNPWLTTIGGMCYTIYLYHYAVMHALGAKTATPALWIGTHRWPNLLLQTVILYLPVILISSVLFAFLEKPFMQRDWPQQWAKAIRSFLGRGKGEGEAETEGRKVG